MLVTISGYAGSGKSTIAKLLAKRLRMSTIDVGAIFRKMAKKRGMSVSEFGRLAEQHPDIDRNFDDEILRVAKQRKNLILQGRLTGVLTHRRGIPAYRIWLDAPLK